MALHAHWEHHTSHPGFSKQLRLLLLDQERLIEHSTTFLQGCLKHFASMSWYGLIRRYKRNEANLYHERSLCLSKCTSFPATLSDASTRAASPSLADVILETESEVLEPVMRLTSGALTRFTGQI